MLRSRYRLADASVLQVFTALLETKEVAFEAEEALERALHAYQLSGADLERAWIAHPEARCIRFGRCDEQAADDANVGSRFDSRL